MQKDQTQITTETNSIILETAGNVETSDTMSLNSLKEAQKIAEDAYTKADAARTNMRKILREDKTGAFESLYVIYDKLDVVATKAYNRAGRFSNFIYQLEEEQRAEKSAAARRAKLESS